MKRTGFCLQCGIELAAQKWPFLFCRPCARLRHHGSGRPQASVTVATAIRLGDLLPAKTFQCVDCYSPATEYEHRDYSKPLEVEPVCAKCNSRRPPAKWVQYQPARAMTGRAA